MSLRLQASQTEIWPELRTRKWHQWSLKAVPLSQFWKWLSHPASPCAAPGAAEVLYKPGQVLGTDLTEALLKTLVSKAKHLTRVLPTRSLGKSRKVS